MIPPFHKIPGGFILDPTPVPTMFDGMTVSTMVTDAQSIGALFSVPLIVAAVFWGGRRLLNIARSFFGG